MRESESKSDTSSPVDEGESSQHFDDDDDDEFMDQLATAASTQDVARLKTLLSTRSSTSPSTSGSGSGSTDSAWIKELIHRLFEKESSDKALVVVAALAQMDPFQYLPPLSLAVKDHVQAYAYSLPTTSTAATTATATSLYISPSLLQVWMQQLTLTSIVSVHSNLLSALIHAVQVHGPKLLIPAMEQLSAIWLSKLDIMKKKQTDGNGSAASDASIVAVRCAAIWMDLLVQLGDIVLSLTTTTTTTSTSTTQSTTAFIPPNMLLLEMLQASGEFSSDPLLQMAILDLFPEHFDCSNNNNILSPSLLQPATKQWLTSQELIQSILQFLNDPLLSGAAMQCLSIICTLQDNDDDNSNNNNNDNNLHDYIGSQHLGHIICQHIRNNIGTTTSEVECLSVAQAMSRLAAAAAAATTTKPTNTQQPWQQELLHDAQLRSCWWDMSRISSPKLQAAILTSIAQVLVTLQPQPQPPATTTTETPPPTTTTTTMTPTASSVNFGIHIYSCLAQDNGITDPWITTTDWIYNKYVKSPMPELRIAAYTLWSAVAGLFPTGTTLLSTSSNFLTWLFPTNSSSSTSTTTPPPPRESTPDARIARFQVVQTFYQNSMGFLAKDLLQKLEQQLALGPHGVKPVPWDVAME